VQGQARSGLETHTEPWGCREVWGWGQEWVRDGGEKGDPNPQGLRPGPQNMVWAPGPSHPRLGGALVLMCILCLGSGGKKEAM
jgi:hypothetical protein